MSHNYLIINQTEIPTAEELIQKVESSQSDDIVLSLPTSGSQQQAKIALISQHNIIAHCQSFTRIIAMDQHSVWLNCMPLHHIAGIMIVYRCWYAKAAIIIHDEFNEKKIWHELQRGQISHISLVPRMLLRLLDYQDSLEHHSRQPLPASLKYVLIGGDSLSATLYQRAIESGWPIYVSYGMTEATSTIAIGRNPDQLELLPNISAKLDTNGVLALKGDMLISHYAKGSCLDKGWFKSNDLALIDGKNLTILGRNDYLIIRSGEKIQPGVIEQLFSHLPQTPDIAIAGYRQSAADERGDSIVALISFTHKNNMINIESLQQWARANIKTFYQPDYFFRVDDIPRTALGKINRAKVQLLLNDIMLNE